jgi:hypothetical protein
MLGVSEDSLDDVGEAVVNNVGLTLLVMLGEGDSE